jgi:hypothetical protein
MKKKVNYIFSGEEIVKLLMDLQKEQIAKDLPEAAYVYGNVKFSEIAGEGSIVLTVRAAEEGEEEENV